MSPALHLALAQFKPRKGDYAANLERVRDIFGRVAALEPRPTVLHLPPGTSSRAACATSR
jgi:predicted amidohydrolase